MSKTIRKYLESHAEPIPELEAIAALGVFQEAVFVPCCGENEIVDGLLESLEVAARASAKSVLAVLVINESPLSPLPHRRANALLLARLRDTRVSERLTVTCVDRTGEKAFAPRLGVGYARKLGADLVLRLHALGRVQSHWIHTTDADARVADDYFELEPIGTVPWGLGPMPAGAFVHPFSHSRDGDLGRALEAYDGFLRYYAERLAYAGSPFSFPTIGSTLSFSTEAYAAVRGFPKKEAGEDFYFLHKVAKVAFVWHGGGEVRLVCRPSNRVPFGTGRSIERIQGLWQSGKEYEVYEPRVFDRLRDWLRAIDALSDGQTWESATAHFAPELLAALETLGAPAAHARIASGRSGKDHLRAWHTWFDGFATLKLIHTLRDSGHPNIPWPRTN